MFDNKAQLHTLEGVAASALILLVIIYAIDATSITPLSSSTSNVHVESELALLGQDILNTLDYAEPGEISKLKKDIINWDGRQYQWSGKKYVEIGNIENNISNNITEILNTTLISKGIAHRVEVSYIIRSNNLTYASAPELMIYAGVPSDNAVIISRKIVLQNSDIIRDPNSTNPIYDVDPATNFWNIADVKLVLWRT
ncbi:MAG: hypothetical protein J5U17_10895 [Candidatus Methanoperedens sp.]|nr:hypothetical protein [Candidatus Methanoperedens sp.]